MRSLLTVCLVSVLVLAASDDTTDRPVTAALKLLVRPEDIIIPKDPKEAVTTTTTTSTVSPFSSTITSSKPDLITSKRHRYNPVLKMKDLSSILRWGSKRRRSTLPPYIPSLNNKKRKQKFRPRKPIERTIPKILSTTTTRPNSSTTSTPAESTTTVTTSPTSTTSQKSANPNPLVHTVVPNYTKNDEANDPVQVIYPAGTSTNNSQFAQLESFFNQQQHTTERQEFLNSHSAISHYNGYIDHQFEVHNETIGNSSDSNSTTPWPSRHSADPPSPPVTSTQSLGDTFPADLSSREFLQLQENSLSKGHSGEELIDRLDPWSVSSIDYLSSPSPPGKEDGDYENIQDELNFLNDRDHLRPPKRKFKTKQQNEFQFLKEFGPVQVGTSIYIADDSNEGSFSKHKATKSNTEIQSGNLSPNDSDDDDDMLDFESEIRHLSESLKAKKEKKQVSRNDHDEVDDRDDVSFHETGKMLLAKGNPGNSQVDQVHEDYDEDFAEFHDDEALRAPKIFDIPKKWIDFPVSKFGLRANTLLHDEVQRKRQAPKKPSYFDPYNRSRQRRPWNDQETSYSDVRNSQAISPLVTVTSTEETLGHIYHPEQAPSYEDVIQKNILNSFGNRVERVTEKTRITPDQLPQITTYRPKFRLENVENNNKVIESKDQRILLPTLPTSSPTTSTTVSITVTVSSTTTASTTSTTTSPNSEDELDYNKSITHFPSANSIATSSSTPRWNTNRVQRERRKSKFRDRSRHPTTADPYIDKKKISRPDKISANRRNQRRRQRMRGRQYQRQKIANPERLSFSGRLKKKPVWAFSRNSGGNQVTGSPEGYHVVTPGAYVKVNFRSKDDQYQTRFSITTTATSTARTTSEKPQKDPRDDEEFYRTNFQSYEDIEDEKPYRPRRKVNTKIRNDISNPTASRIREFSTPEPSEEKTDFNKYSYNYKIIDPMSLAPPKDKTEEKSNDFFGNTFKFGSSLELEDSDETFEEKGIQILPSSFNNPVFPSFFNIPDDDTNYQSSFSAKNEYGSSDGSLGPQFPIPPLSYQKFPGHETRRRKDSHVLDVIYDYHDNDKTKLVDENIPPSTREPVKIDRLDSGHKYELVDEDGDEELEKFFLDGIDKDIGFFYQDVNKNDPDYQFLAPIPVHEEVLLAPERVPDPSNEPLNSNPDIAESIQLDYPDYSYTIPNEEDIPEYQISSLREAIYNTQPHSHHDNPTNRQRDQSDYPRTTTTASPTTRQSTELQSEPRAIPNVISKYKSKTRPRRRNRPRQQNPKQDLSSPKPKAEAIEISPDKPDNIYNTILSSDNLNIFANLLDQASLSGMLSDQKDGPFTIFVPNDRALETFLENRFGSLKKGLHKLKEDEVELSKLLRNHIVRGFVTSSSLEDDLVGSSLSGSKLRSNVYVTETPDWREVTIKTINGAIMLDVDLESSNGIGHVIDRVLYPPATGNLIEQLQSDPKQRFTTFLKALKATKLDKDLSDYATGPWTLFVPTNEAFMNLPMTYLEDLIRDHDKLRKLIANHVVNRTIFHAGLRSHEVVTMANGADLNFFSRTGRLKIEGADVVTMDIPATNGVIHVLENVIELPDK